jgi:dihydrofolate reductase
MVTLYNVISEDWFIAREDGSEDFISDELWPETLRIHTEFDVLVMGRKTYETIQSYPPELQETLEALELRKVVVTHNPDFVAKEGYEVMTRPEDALGLSGKILVSSGPTLNNYLFQNKLVNKVILRQVPEAIAEGIPVFDTQYRELLILKSETQLSKAKESRYTVG